MAFDRESLEGGVRLAQVRRIKKLMIIAQAVLVLGVVIILTLLDGHIQLEPFYFNIASVVYFVVLMLLIIGLENFIFKLLELKFMKSQSEKYFMLKASGRRSIIVIVAAILVLVVLLTPIIANTLANLNSPSERTAASAAFMNRDPLGLTVVDRLTVKSDQPTDIVVLTEENYLLYAGNMTLMRQHSTLYMTSLPVEQSIAFPDIPFEKFYLVVDPEDPYAVSYTIHKTMSSQFVALVSLFATLFIGFYVIWVVTTFRLNKEYAKGAIYR